jgi:molecular chaperone DnaK (HSP70)
MDVRIGQELRRPFAVRGSPVDITTRRIFAVDFATTRSVLGLYNKGCSSGEFWAPGNIGLVPTAIAFDQDLNYEVGIPALSAIGDPSRLVIRNFKRLLGREHIFNVFGRSLTVEFIASLVIRSLKLNAEEVLGTAISRVSVSYPVGFTLRQINALGTAFVNAGLEVERFVAEPCAATYLLDLHRAVFDARQPGSTSGVFIDLGGGTFDVAGLEAGDSVLKITTIDGDRHLRLC